VKKTAVELLRKPYASQEQAARDIPPPCGNSIRARSRRPRSPGPPWRWSPFTSRNVFPEMKVTWGSYPTTSATPTSRAAPLPRRQPRDRPRREDRSGLQHLPSVAGHGRGGAQDPHRPGAPVTAIAAYNWCGATAHVPADKILLPVDFSERCLGGARYAEALAAHFQPKSPCSTSSIRSARTPSSSAASSWKSSPGCACVGCCWRRPGSQDRRVRPPRGDGPDRAADPWPRPVPALHPGLGDRQGASRRGLPGCGPASIWSRRPKWIRSLSAASCARWIWAAKP